MADTETFLCPAEQADVEQAIAHALMFDGRKQFDRARHYMAELTAAHLVACLARSGFVVMRKPPAPAHSAPDYLKHLKD